jgi:hypothetical protein
LLACFSFVGIATFSEIVVESSNPHGGLLIALSSPLNPCADRTHRDDEETTLTAARIAQCLWMEGSGTRATAGCTRAGEGAVQSDADT